MYHVVVYITKISVFYNFHGENVGTVSTKLNDFLASVDANTPLRLKLSNSINLWSVITITTLKFSIWDPTSRLHFALACLWIGKSSIKLAIFHWIHWFNKLRASCLRMCRETWSKPFIANFWSSREWNARKNWNIIKMRQVMPLQKCQKDSQWGRLL